MRMRPFESAGEITEPLCAFTFLLKVGKPVASLCKCYIDVCYIDVRFSEVFLLEQSWAQSRLKS